MFEVEDVQPLTVDQWLDGVDYSIDPNYVPSVFALQFIEFIKQANGVKGDENKTPVLHYHILDQLGTLQPATIQTRIANMIHRGAAKTTLNQWLILYLAAFQHIPNFGAVNLLLYVSDSIDNGVKNMRKNLEYRYENSPLLKQLIPSIKFTDIRWEFTNTEGKQFIVKGYGAKTGVRGTQELGIRPNVAILDDLISDDDARSKTVVESVKVTVSNAIEFALHPKKNLIIWCGTPFNANDPLYVAVESGAWKVNVFPVCEKFPCTKDEFRGSWPDRFTYEYVLGVYTKSVKEGKADAFYQELMLRVMNDDDRIISKEDVRWYDRNAILQNLSNYNIYMTTDYATSEKQSADFSSINVWAVNNNKDIYWLDGVLAKQTMDLNINDTFRLAQKYRPMEVGIEVSGQQGGFIQWILQEMIQRNIFFNLASNNNSNKPGIRPATDKLSRFNTVVPLFKMGKMYFPIQMRTSEILVEGIERQLLLISRGGIKSKKDDFIDGVSQLSLLNIFYPSADNTLVVQGRDKVWGSSQEDTGYRISSYIV